MGKPPRYLAQADVEPQFSNIPSNKIAFNSHRINNPHIKQTTRKNADIISEKLAPKNSNLLTRLIKYVCLKVLKR